jgi:hypothetical protein
MLCSADFPDLRTHLKLLLFDDVFVELCGKIISGIKSWGSLSFLFICLVSHGTRCFD